MKAALVTCSSYRVNREAVLAVQREAIVQADDLSRQLGCELVAVPGVPASDAELADRIKALSEQSPSVLILHCAGWTEDETVLKVVESFTCPKFLWATRDEFVDGISQLVAHVGYMEAASVLRKSNRKVFRFYGGPDDDSRSALRSFLLAAKALESVRTLRFGCTGQGYGAAGILDGVFDEAALREQLGVELVRIEQEELFSRYRKVSPEETADPDSFESPFERNVARTVLAQVGDQRAAVDSLRVLRAVRTIVEDYELGGLCIRCFPEFKENDVPTPCLAVSVLNDLGIPASCEGDILSGVSMFILSRLTGNPATMMDVFSCDEDRNTMDLFHCGATSAAFADGPGSCRYLTHCKPRVHRAGATVEFSLKEGGVTFLKLDHLDNRFKLYAYAGRAVQPGAFLRGAQATVQTDSPVKELIEKLLDEGVSHHQVLCFGEVARESKLFADMAGLELVQW